MHALGVASRQIPVVRQLVLKLVHIAAIQMMGHVYKVIHSQDIHLAATIVTTHVPTTILAQIREVHTTQPVSPT